MKISVTAETVVNDIAKAITSENKETMQGVKRPNDASFPVVEILDGALFTTSLNVAKVYGKRHDHVIRDIKAVMADCPPEFNLPNFGEISYTDSSGRTYPAYRLSRDGRLPAIIETGKDNGNGASQEAFYRLLWPTKKTGLLRNQKPKK